MDADPNEYYIAAVFESREAYWANARSPEQDTRYRQWLPLLDGEPEWHDGEINVFYALPGELSFRKRSIRSIDFLKMELESSIAVTAHEGEEMKSHGQTK